MTNKDLRISNRDLAVSLAVKRALEMFPPERVDQIVLRNPIITVNEFCKSYLAGLELRCYGGTRRAYGMVYQRLHRARRKFGLSIPR